MSYLLNFKRALHSQRQRIKVATPKPGASSGPLGHPLDESAAVTRPTQPQPVSTSPLLQGLPLEIRLQVWEEVLGGNLFHVTAETPRSTQMCDIDEAQPSPWRRQTPSLGRYLCRNFSMDTTSDGKASYPRCLGSQAEPCFFSGPEVTAFNPLSLLLACRQIHDEAVVLLYSANTFNFDHELTLSQFMSLDTRRHFSHIRTVHVSTAMWRISRWEFAPIYTAASVAPIREPWIRLWPLLMEFEKLMHIRLDVCGTSKHGLQMEDLEPILQLRGLHTFDLAIWRDVSGPDSPKQDLVVSGPLQESIRSSVCK
ncbi:hypothetical protein XANCAGTX0491_006031 [Xanthoria calcicola]